MLLTECCANVLLNEWRETEDIELWDLLVPSIFPIWLEAPPAAVNDLYRLEPVMQIESLDEDIFYESQNHT